MAGDVPGYEQQEIFRGPLCLIETEKDGKLKVVSETLAQIQKIDVPVVVIAIVGLYRTGKSYLMNRLAGASSGFALGKTIESKTKGIWSWCRTHPEKANTVLLLLDTEGLGDVKKGDVGHDNRIFTLAALLCNVLVYNVMTAFNQDAVGKLTFVSEISQSIRFQNNTPDEQENDQLGLILPTFVLCVRDFTLELEEDGREMTPDEYLEYCLALLPSENPDAKMINRPRESIRKYFQTRKCFTFETPGSKKVIKQLESLALDALSEEFVEQTKRFLEYMYAQEPKVLLCSKPLTGNMFSSLVETYVKAIREDGVPDVDDAMTVVAKMENERLANKIVQQFNDKLHQITLPQFSTKEFEDKYRKYQAQTLEDFRTESVFDSRKIEVELIDRMDTIWKERSKTNLELVKKHCAEELETIFKTVVGESLEKYHKPDGYREYRANMGRVESEYLQKMDRIDESSLLSVLHAFAEKERKNENQIMMADQKLSAEDRQREFERVINEITKVQEKQQKAFLLQMQEEKEHNRKLEEDRRIHEQRESEKREKLMNEWREKTELSMIEMQAMRDNNEKLRKKLKKAERKASEERERAKQEEERLQSRIARNEESGCSIQ